MNGPVCVATSGGIESATLLLDARQGRADVWPFYVRGGHHWERAELHWLRRLLARLRRPGLRALTLVDLPVRDVYRGARWSLSGRNAPSAVSADEAVYLPGRNILILSKLAVACAERGIGCVRLGTLGSNPFPDASPRFFRKMEAALSEGLARRIRVEAPLRGLKKHELIARFPGAPWGLTFSCIAPRGLLHCGRCNKCAERRAAFKRAGVPDPTKYARR